MKEQYLTVGELAKKMGVTVRTLQYYDKENILNPSAFSEGGRRLYSQKDVVKLHQITSFKSLGFSLEEIKSQLFVLDTPEEVTEMLNHQIETMQKQIQSYQNTLKLLTLLRDEVKEIKSVDFSKYAEIVELLKVGNENYWVWKHFDSPMKEHIAKRFGDDADVGNQIFHTYSLLLSEALSLKQQGEDPRSKKSFVLAEKWWAMVMEFTGGDLSLLPLLQEFNQTKDNWDNEFSEKQKQIDKYLEEIMKGYFEKINGGDS